MKPGAYPYPPDEFDAAARSGGPRGVHRAPRSRWSRWWPFLVVLVVFPALAYWGATFLADWQGLGGDEDPDAAPTSSVDPSAEAEEGEGEGEDEPETEPSASPTPEEPPAPPADTTRPVDVYNATNRSGLAANAGGRLEAVGFTDVSALNWDGEDPATSIVYYGVAADVTTAQLVGSTLGIAQVVLSTEQAPEGIVVVLAADYTPA
ncbi:MAG: LytR C-terminal domain-containing protein [Actinomycetales bacterium]|nr:LytR C-terminal domain-containing protein [Actinomycetales bacterium]